MPFKVFVLPLVRYNCVISLVASDAPSIRIFWPGHHNAMERLLEAVRGEGAKARMFIREFEYVNMDHHDVFAQSQNLSAAR